MSKNLEKEYSAFVNSEVPDLWSRIEAGLDEKTPLGSSSSVSDIDTDNKAKQTDLRMNGRRFKKSSLRVWAGLAAACACVVLVVPAMMKTMWRESGSSFSGGAASDNAAAPMDSYDMAEGAYDNGAYQEDGAYIDGAAGEVPEAAYEDSVAQAAEAAAEESGSVQGNVHHSTASENVYINSDMGTDTTAKADLNAGTEDNAALMEVPKENPGSLTEVLDENTSSFEATVEILDADVRMDSGILYTAKVILSDSPDILADSEIKIFSPAGTPKGVRALETAQTYKLLLCESDLDVFTEFQQEKTYVIVED